MGVVAGYTSVPPDVAERCQTDTDYCLSVLSEEGQLAESRHLYLDKAWDGLNYLISPARRVSYNPHESTDVLRQAIEGTEELNPAVDHTMLIPAQVAAQAAALLAGMTCDSLREHYSPEAMEAADVYPTDAWDDDGLSYPTSYFEDFKAFYAEAAKAGHAVIVGFC
jgi:hypothetical protein